MHLSNETFLERLSDLFDQQQDAGSVFLNLKRLTYDVPTAPEPGSDVSMQPVDTSSNSREFPLLIRATDGKGNKQVKTKLSTIVQSRDYSGFIERYTEILRSNLSSGLRPKRKRKTTATSSSSSSTAAAKKSKSTTTTTTTIGGGGGGGGKTKMTFTSRLPKLVGPRRGNGRRKRTNAKNKRERMIKRTTRGGGGGGRSM